MNELASNSSSESALLFSAWAGASKGNDKKSRTDKKPFKTRIFKSACFYKDLFFNVFNIRVIENRENVKYSTKNNIRAATAVFLATKNHNRARTISTSILRVTDTIICIVREDGSFFIPLWKIKRERSVIAVKQNVRIRKSGIAIPKLKNVRRRDPPAKRIVTGIIKMTIYRVNFTLNKKSGFYSGKRKFVI